MNRRYTIKRWSGPERTLSILTTDALNWQLVDRTLVWEYANGTWCGKVLCPDDRFEVSQHPVQIGY